MVGEGSAVGVGSGVGGSAVGVGSRVSEASAVGDGSDAGSSVGRDVAAGGGDAFVEMAGGRDGRAVGAAVAGTVIAVGDASAAASTVAASGPRKSSTNSTALATNDSPSKIGKA
jgi:hypothetical protein